MVAFTNYAIDVGINFCNHIAKPFEAFIIQQNIIVMKKQLISSGSTFETQIGYSRAVVQGDWIFVSGTTGFDYDNMTISDTIEEQAEQCLKNIIAALTKAEAEISDVVRVLYIVPNADEFKDCWPILRKYFGDIRPAATMIAAGLADSRMKIEIEVTALKQKNR